MYVLPSRTPPSHCHSEVIEKQASYIQEKIALQSHAFRGKTGNTASWYSITNERARYRSWLALSFLIDFEKENRKSS